MTFLAEPRRAAVVGLGLIGGSVGLALRARGWRVAGRDRDPERERRALAEGVLDAIGSDPGAEITFVATPVQEVPAAVRAALAAGPGLVTDVGSVKAGLVEAVGDPRFVGGHPMAGSEQEGLDGADPTLFEGAVWVLTPTATTPDATLAAVGAVVASMGAEVVVLAPARHDALVAVVSHVPHLTAATLMALADQRAEEHAALLRLAAGGFRDMTRVASGHPGIWPDICAENRTAIVDSLDALIEGLADLRDLVDKGDRAGLLAVLERARAGRLNLPARGARPPELAEVRVPVPDRPGVLAEITTLAAELAANISDMEIAHSAEGDRGVAILLVDQAAAERFRGGLVARGYRPSVRNLE
ncbi:MAG: prephenate dehydrogenase/arogenate dehydrogenase family protein [Acidimicrobiales bacterium]|nr:prephenate dehydrogenase/arogenate dehydrogenase family protein [Acidimicrobiales bacterium]